MGIFEEVDKGMGRTPEGRIRQLLSDYESARRYFDRWRQEADDAQKRIEILQQELTDKTTILNEQLAASERLRFEAEAAARFLAGELQEISGFIEEKFSDVAVERNVDPEKPPDTSRVTIDGERKPITVSERTIGLLIELLKIREKFGGSSLDKINRIAQAVLDRQAQQSEV